MRCFVWVLVAVLALQGCTGIDDEGAEDGGFVTAMARLGVAEAIARDWNDDAVLMGAVGVESNNGSLSEAGGEDDGDDPYPYLLGRDDPRIGDGLAPAWMYAFSPPAVNETLVLVLASNGTEMYRDELDDDVPEQPLRDWRIDSDEAMGIARTHDDDWTVLSNEHTVGLWLVGGELNETTGEQLDPMWLLWLEGPEGGDLAASFVNATTGEYMGNFSFDFDFEFPFPFFVSAEYGEWEDDVSVLAPADAFQFDIAQEGHGQLNIRLFVDLAAPGHELGILVEGPTGVIVDEVLSFPGGGSAGAVWTSTPVEVGDYTISISLEDGVAQAYYVQYCATGFLIAFPDLRPGPFDRPHPCDAEGSANPSYSASHWAARNP